MELNQFKLLKKCEGNALTSACQNIRIELKAKWPSIKFSARSKRFSMGDDINVSWTDGPTPKQVDAIIGKYQYGDFDGMTDSYNYAQGQYGKFCDMFGGSKYVFSRREHSPELIAIAIKAVYEKFGTPGELPTADDFLKGRLFNVMVNPNDSWSDHWSIQQQIHLYLAQHDCTSTAPTEWNLYHA